MSCKLAGFLPEEDVWMIPVLDALVGRGSAEDGDQFSSKNCRVFY